MKEIHERKIMYHMIMALEHDLIEFLYPVLSTNDFSNEMMSKIEARNAHAYNIKEMLEQLGIGDFIELINKCRSKLEITQNEIDFINKNCNSSIVQIRNRVMHPKPLMFDDFAVLQNLFNKIDQYIHSIAWLNVIASRDELEKNFDQVLEKDVLEYKKGLIDNLPELNCEEIEFVGRGKEIGDLKKLLLNDKIRVISVVAAGGYGKTALTLKVLNDFKQENNSPFEMIVWISFKTRQLDKTSFVDINNAIINMASMNEYVYNFIGGNAENSQQELIDLAKQFNALLVLDNLETINQQEMFPFIEEFCNYGRVLITSRVSLGELDKRYDLLPLIKNDALELANRMLNFYNLDDKFTNKDVEELTEEILFSNPLSIKWAIRSLHDGATIETIKQGRENVVSFCMSNVYDKISPLGKSILTLLAFNNSAMTMGQIVYYLQKTADDLVEINTAITQLTRACFIDKAKMKQGFYELIEQGKIFMDSLTATSGLKELFTNKKREINTIHQDIAVASEQYPYNNDSITIFNNNEDCIISAFYLYKAVGLMHEKKNDEALELIMLAENISPGYCECYKLHGLVLNYMGDPEAENKYLEAINKSKTTREILIQLVAITNYYIRANNYPEALKRIEQATLRDGNNIFVILEKTKVLLYVGKYSEAEELLNSIKIEKTCSQKEYNIYITRKADLKRRKAEQLDEISQKEQRKDLLLDAFFALAEEKNPDDYMNAMLCKIAADMVFLSNFNDFAEKVLNVIFERLPSLLPLSPYNDFKRKLKINLDSLEQSLAIKCLQVIFGLDIANYDDNVGQISLVKDTYGFIVNAKYPSGIYFVNFGEFKKGDKVTFKVIRKYDKPRAINLRLIEETEC